MRYSPGKWSPILLGFSVAGVLFLTLTPAPPTPGEPKVAIELGPRAIADALANIVLFLPFGVAAALAWRGWRRPLLLGLLLSLIVEIIQLAVPGRYTSPADLLCNGLGTAAGVAIVRTHRWWRHPPAFVAPIMAWVALAVALLVIAAAPALFAPSVPVRPLFGQWTANFANMSPYDGRVDSAWVGDMFVRSRRIRDSATLRSNLLTAAPIRLQIVVSTPPPSLAAIFSVFDDRAQEMLLFGADGLDAVLRFRMRAHDLGLDEPFLRFDDAFAGVRPGEPAEVRLWRTSSHYCLTVNRRNSCAGLGLADGWALLHHPLPDPLAALMPFAWTAALLLPAGLWLRGRGHLLAAVLVTFVVLAATPALTASVPSPPLLYAAAAAGLLGGQMLRRFSLDRRGGVAGILLL
jgi:VanZ family protein